VAHGGSRGPAAGVYDVIHGPPGTDVAQPHRSSIPARLQLRGEFVVNGAAGSRTVALGRAALERVGIRSSPSNVG
jgi:hypothetical protein